MPITDKEQEFMDYMANSLPRPALLSPYHIKNNHYYVSNLGDLRDLPSDKLYSVYNDSVLWAYKHAGKSGRAGPILGIARRPENAPIEVLVNGYQMLYDDQPLQGMPIEHDNLFTNVRNVQNQLYHILMDRTKDIRKRRRQK